MMVAKVSGNRELATSPTGRYAYTTRCSKKGYSGVGSRTFAANERLPNLRSHFGTHPEEIVYERSEFYIVIGVGIVEEIGVKAEYMGGLADRILK